MRHVPTKWEMGGAISFLSFDWIHIAQTISFEMIYNMVGLLNIGMKL